MHVERADIFNHLQSDILRFQGFKSANNNGVDLGLGLIKDAFPNSSFPLAAVHEFISEQKEQTTTSSAFIAGLLSSLLGDHGAAVWISSARTLFPPALKNFGITPDHFVFVDIRKERDVLWAMDEALKCSGVSAVIGEVNGMNFNESRRLQLAVEKSQVTGFVIRKNSRAVGTTASTSKWKIYSLPSESINQLPGIGYPKWRVELLKVKNGRPGSWDIEWVKGKFRTVPKFSLSRDHQKKAG